MQAREKSDADWLFLGFYGNYDGEAFQASVYYVILSSLTSKISLSLLLRLSIFIPTSIDIINNTNLEKR